MSKYLTPAILRVSGTGLPFARRSDLELAGLIEAAEAEVDAYMGFAGEASGAGFAPMVHSESGPLDAASRRYYFKSFPVPVLAVTAFALQIGQQQGTGTPVVFTLEPTQIVINNDMGYLQPSSLALVYGVTPAVISSLAFIDPFARVTYTAGYAESKITRPLYSTDQMTYHSLVPNWSLVLQTPLVSVNGVTQDAASYDVDDLNGQIAFHSVLQPTDVVRATFTHQVPTAITQATRRCCEELSHDFFAGLAGLAGLDEADTGGMHLKRKGTLTGKSYRGAERPPMDWRDMVDEFRTLKVGRSSR